MLSSFQSAVIVPADFNQTKQATIAIADHQGPVYLRFGRPVMPIFIKPDAPFIIRYIDSKVEAAINIKVVKTSMR